MFGACGDVGESIKKSTCRDSELGTELSRNERKDILKNLDDLIEAAICLRQAVIE